MVTGSSKVTRKGQVTIPIGIRKELDIKEGDTILFEKRDGAVVIVRPKDLVNRTAGIFKEYARNMDSPDPTREEIWTGIARERGSIDQHGK